MGVMRKLLVSAAVLGFAIVAAPQAHAQGVITNGTVSLGVDLGGNLNVTSCTRVEAPGIPRCGVGVYANGSGHESTFDGCPCEGWGAGVTGLATDPYVGANANAYGFGAISGGTSVSYADNGTITTPASTATTVVDMLGGAMRVTHFFHPSAVADLYQVDVTITNMSSGVLGGAGTDAIRYMREMDWDIEPTPFDEYSTIHGWGAANLVHSSDNGFVDSNVNVAPGLQGCTDFTATAAAVDANFYHSGPCDHGAAFVFGFPSLAAGESKSFTIFYGAAENEASALIDLTNVSADDVYSLAQHDGGCGTDDACIAAEETFIFGFKGVGGHTVASPEPASIALMATGLVGLAGFARRRRRAA